MNCLHILNNDSTRLDQLLSLENQLAGLHIQSVKISVNLTTPSNDKAEKDTVGPDKIEHEEQKLLKTPKLMIVDYNEKASDKPKEDK